LSILIVEVSASIESQSYLSPESLRISDTDQNENLTESNRAKYLYDFIEFYKQRIYYAYNGEEKHSGCIRT